MAKVFTLLSGKGGVGKSTMAAALSMCLARQSIRITVVDCDMRLGCLDLLMGLSNHSNWDMGHVLQGCCTLQEALISSPELPTLQLLAAPQFVQAADVKAAEIVRLIQALAQQTDIILLDAPAGLGRGMKILLKALGTPVLVATPDPICQRDARQTAEIITSLANEPLLLLNRVQPQWIRRGTMPTPQHQAEALSLPLLGIIPDSRAVFQAEMLGKDLSNIKDNTFQQSILITATRMLGAQTPLPEYMQSPMLRVFSAQTGSKR